MAAIGDGTNDWWLQDPSERFWMESTDRRDLGANLIAPISSHAGQKLVAHVKDGDVVVHYFQPTHEIVAFSIAEGEPFHSLLRWPDRELSEEAPAFEEAIGHFTFLDEPITLQQIRDHEDEIRLIKSELDLLLDGQSVYFPFQIPSTRQIAPAQGAYLTKLPKAVFDLFPSLQQALELQFYVPSAPPDDSVSAVGLEKPRNKPRGALGGRQNDVKKKIAAEKHAMNEATAFLENLGFEVEDVSGQPSLGYDLRGVNGIEIVGCEVKGSLNSRIGVDLQSSEVDFAQRVIAPYRSLLFVVDQIDLALSGDEFLASGGRSRHFWDWNPRDIDLTPISFRFILPV